MIGTSRMNDYLFSIEECARFMDGDLRDYKSGEELYGRKTVIK